MAEPSRDFTHAELPTVHKQVLRLGLAGNYGVKTQDVRYAAERGVNFWLWAPSFKNVTPALHELLAADRERHVVSMLDMAVTAGMVRRGVHKALRRLRTDYLDCYKLGWLNRTAFLTEGVSAELLRLKEQGKIRSIGTSIHDRKRAGELALDSILDTFMIRYNAKHPGAEEDIFPHLSKRNPAIISYTTTSWRQLLRPLEGIEMPPWPGGDPGGATPPPLTPGLCYRFCLSSPHVHVVLTGPKSRGQLDENLAALEAGPLTAAEDEWVRSYGRLVKKRKRLPFL
ncbi:MAG: aldo/keto reductase [Deltaproteobacteria bacterium]|nr:aldo/keto reductase [Deltaproteobacteria bacterium]MBW2534849.1 aldo/keto reductase [Deltaproteobacteria bacterium]